MHTDLTDATDPLPSSTHGSSSDQDDLSDNEDATETSELLVPEKSLLEKSSN